MIIWKNIVFFLHHPKKLLLFTGCDEIGAPVKVWSAQSEGFLLQLTASASMTAHPLHLHMGLVDSGSNYQPTHAASGTWLNQPLRYRRHIRIKGRQAYR
jgi:hypothetical protein